MKRYKVYLAGKMSGLSYEQQMKWRIEMTNLIKRKSSGDACVSIISPPSYYSPSDQNASAVEAEAMVWDLNQIRDSDIVIVNLEGIESSIGTHMELGYINAVNSFGGKHIFVVGFGNVNPDSLHPWIRMNLFHFEPDLASAAEYVADYLLL